MSRRKVVSLRGAAVPQPYVNKAVVDDLKDLQREARDGNIAGILYAYVTPFGQVTTGWSGNAEKHDMLAASTILHHRVVRRVIEPLD